MENTIVRSTDEHAIEKFDAFCQRMRHVLREQADGGWAATLESDGERALLLIEAELIPPFTVEKITAEQPIVADAARALDDTDVLLDEVAPAAPLTSKQE